MNITILGAGKTGRGFIARLLKEENHTFSLIDNNVLLIESLTGNRYSIGFFGNEREPMTIDNFAVFVAHSKQASQAISHADVLYVSVGVKNFPDIAKQLAADTEERKQGSPLFVITCENAIGPGKKLRELFLEAGGDDKKVRIGEAAIFCTTIEDQDNPLNIMSEDYPLLPLSCPQDFPVEEFSFMRPTKSFGSLLKRKIYTYNAASSIIAYLGWYKGYEVYSDAANDHIIDALLDEQYSKINKAIVDLFPVSEQEQLEFSVMAKKKFQNVYIRDSIERNAKEASRKLGNDERIIGPMKLLLQVHTFSIPLALTAAIAIRYGIEHEQAMRDDFSNGGLEMILSKYSSLPKNSMLYDLVEEYFVKVQKDMSIEGILQENDNLNVLIFGAGKIARGFIGHILWRAQIKYRFIDKNEDLVRSLNDKGCYPVRILDEKVQTDIVTDITAWSYKDKAKIEDAISGSVNNIFISVGGKNLSGITDLLRDSLIKRMNQGNTSLLNIVLCENWKKPADVLKANLLENSTKAFNEFLNEYVGITEAVILRSGIEPTIEVLRENPLTVNVQNYWNFPVDAKKLKRRLPVFPGLHYVEDFNGFLTEKFYTYNAANGCVSYLGNLKGHIYLYDAATDPDIIAILEEVYKETSLALCKKLGLDPQEHYEFTRTSLRKLQNKYIVDYVERNARDPIRKLGPNDRLIGPAMLVLENGGTPEALSTVIAAAIYYDNPDDPIAQILTALVKEEGIEYVLDSICKLSDQKELKKLIVQKVSMLKERGWIKEK